jgi:hypothetical protein
VPAVEVLDERNALPFDRLGDDGRRLPRFPDPLIGLEDLGDPVTVHGHDVPAKGLELGRIGLEVVFVHRRVGLAEAVDVDDGAEVAEPAPGRGVGRFPYLALGALPIPHEDERPGLSPVEPLGEGYSDADRKSLSERARRHFDPGMRGVGPQGRSELRGRGPRRWDDPAPAQRAQERQVPDRTNSRPRVIRSGVKRIVEEQEVCNDAERVAILCRASIFAAPRPPFLEPVSRRPGYEGRS